MELYFRRFGAGGGRRPLLILHGLLGSSRNWTTVGAQLADDRKVVALDLRNHGASPHADTHTYPELAADILAWMDARGMDRVDLIGHSMGGKAVMRLAADHPERVGRLVIVDIAPRDNPPYNQRAFGALNALALDAISSRKEAEAFLQERLRNWAFCQFLLTNLVRGENGFSWQVNLPVLTENLSQLAKSPLEPEETYAGPALFVRGGRSDFVRDEDETLIRRHFPAARIDVIPESGHNPHIEQREAFVAMVSAFLKE